MMCLVEQEKIFDKYMEVIKDRRKNSNVYFTLNDFRVMCENKTIYAYELEKTLLIVEKEEYFNNLYYICDSWDWLYNIDEIKKNHQKLVVSIVQKDIQEDKVFRDKGFKLYKTYQRLRKVENDVILKKDIVLDYGLLDDKDNLRNMMNETFDAFTDHIPTEDELDEFIKQQNIICLREQDKIAGFIIFEDKGKTSYIRMVCVDKAFRGKGIGKYLMNVYFQIHKEFKSFTLWYDVNNQTAISLYSKWGYREERMYNLIYIA